MATVFQVFDLKEVARSEVKQQARERRCVDGGFEAPRNSLDVPFEADDDSRSSIFKPDDIPFGYEYYSPALAASIRRSKKGGPSNSVSHGNSPTGRCDSRRRAPNVVARLMGLDSFPDDVPTRKYSQPGTPTHGSPKPGNPGLTRQQSQGAVPSSWQRPPPPRCAPAEERIRAPVLAFRDHPQEEQLQKFKKEFEAKQQAAFAKKQEQLRNLRLEDKNRELEEKKEKVRATLVKAKSALSLAESKTRLNGESQFEESKEFLDAMKFLQSNKDFIFQFLQPKSEDGACSNEDSNTTTQATHLEKSRGDASSLSSARKRDGFSPRAFARLFLNPRKWNDSKQQPASDIVSQTTQPATVDRCNGIGFRGASTEELLDDEKRGSSSSTNSRSESRALTAPKSLDEPLRNEAHKGGARVVIMKIKERLRQREHCDRTGEDVETDRSQEFLRDSDGVPQKTATNDRRIPNPTRTECLSTSKHVSIHTEDMDDVRYTSDGEKLSTPLVSIVRENARRSSISLPSSPHLSARSQDVTRVIRKRQPAKSGTPPAATLREAETITPLTSESSRQRTSQQVRGSLLSNTEVQNSFRKSASLNENASRRTVLKQRVEASGAICLHHSKEPASNLTRCRSIPNVALLPRRQFPRDAVQTINGELESDKFVATAKISLGKSKHILGPNVEKTKGFFSGGRKKARDGSETTPLAQRLLFPSSTPVLARFVALAESCVSHGKTLSDADNSRDSKLHVRSSRLAATEKGERAQVHEKILSSRKEKCPQVDEILRERSTDYADSVISESSADSDAGSCDDEFLRVLTQLPPLAKSAEADSLMVREALPSTVPGAQQQVENLKTCPQTRRAWTTATRDISKTVDDKVDDEDSNNDSDGQPSPVSVLDAPFEEELLSPEFKDTANSLQGLPIQLRRLNVGRILEDSEHVPDTPRVVPRHQLLNSSVKIQTLTTFRQHKTNPLRHIATTESRTLPYPAGHEPDLAFVRNVLIGSDFITHGGRLISKWHSAMQPISPRVFQKIEISYSFDKNGSDNRRVLFDSINDILAEKLRPRCYEPWTSLSNAITLGTGRRLVGEIWNEIRKRQFPTWCHDLRDDYLESLVAQDLQTSTWMALHHDVNRICFQLEKDIFDDLITDLLLVYSTARR